MSILVKQKVPRLRFPGFDGEWLKKELIDIADFQEGPGILAKDFTDEGTPLIRLKGLAGRTVTLDGCNYLSKEKVNSKWGHFRLADGDLLISTSASLGSVSIVNNASKGAVAYTGIVRFRPRSEITNKYLEVLLRSSQFERQAIALSTGATISHFGPTHLKQMSFSIPGQDEQTKIAGFLTAVDEQIELMEKKLELSKTYKKGLMQKLFPKKGETNPSLRFKKDDGSDFPDWRNQPLSKLLKQEVRATDVPTEPYLGLGVRSHFKGLLQRPDSDPGKIMMDTLFIVKEGDLVVNITFAWEGAVAIAETSDEGGVVSHRFPTYRFNKDIVMGEFFGYIFPTKRFKYELGLASPGGAGRNRVLSKKDFMKISVKVPTTEEQEKIADFMNGIDMKVEEQERKLEQAKQFKKALLQQMFV